MIGLSVLFCALLRGSRLMLVTQQLTYRDETQDRPEFHSPSNSFMK